MCRASLRSFEDFTKVSLSPCVLPMHLWRFFGSLWRIVSAMASNSGGSSSNGICRSDRHMALIMNNELAKPGSIISCCMYVRMQTIQFYPGSIQFERELCSTRFNPVHSADTPLGKCKLNQRLYYGYAVWMISVLLLSSGLSGKNLVAIIFVASLKVQNGEHIIDIHMSSLMLCSTFDNVVLTMF